jgi:hypothetical protein
MGVSLSLKNIQNIRKNGVFVCAGPIRGLQRLIHKNLKNIV